MWGSEGEKKHVIFKYLSVNETIFTSPTRNGTAILRGHQNHAKVSRFAGIRQYQRSSVIFKTLSIGPAPGIEPTDSRYAVKRSTDRANPVVGGGGDASWRFCHCKFNPTRGEVRKLVCHVANDSIFVYTSVEFYRGSVRACLHRGGVRPVSNVVLLPCRTLLIELNSTSARQ